MAGDRWLAPVLGTHAVSDYDYRTAVKILIADHEAQADRERVGGEGLYHRTVVKHLRTVLECPPTHVTELWSSLNRTEFGQPIQDRASFTVVGILEWLFEEIERAELVLPARVER